MKYLYLALSIIFCLAIGFTSGQLTDTAGEVTDYFGEGTDTSIFDNPVPDPYEDPNFIWPSSGDPDEVPFPDQTGRGQRPGTAGGGGS